MNNKEIIIRGRCILPDNINKKIPAVVMLTGDGPSGSKSLSWTNIPPMLLKYNIASILFDFEGLGYSDGDRKNLTLTKGVEDFNLIWEYILNFDWLDISKIGIFSSSFGSNVALLNPNILNQAKALAFKSPACFLPDAYMNELSETDKLNWFKEGYCEQNGYEIDVLLDCFKYNAYNEISKIKRKCLITHGTSDEIVPIMQSYYFINLLKCEKELIEFPNGNHGYSINDYWKKMATIFVDFFNRELN